MVTEEIPVESLMCRFCDDLRQGIIWLACVSRDRTVRERGLITEWVETNDTTIRLELVGRQRLSGDSWENLPPDRVMLTMEHYYVQPTDTGYALVFNDVDGLTESEVGFTISFERAARAA